MKNRLLTVLGISVSALAIQFGARGADSPLVGDWKGTLDVNGVQLRLGFHVTKSKDGGLAATLDSLDQGVKGIQATVHEPSGAAVRFEIATIQGAFEGRLDRGGSKLAGTWTQGPLSLPLNLEKFDPAKAVKGDDRKANPESVEVNKKTGGKLAGHWQGTLNAGASLRLVFKISKSSDGGLLGAMDSLDQNASDIPITSIRSSGEKIRFEVKTIGGAFEGPLNREATELSGVWEQGGGSLPLTLERQAK